MNKYKLFNYKLTASSIVEVSVALVITAFVFTVALMIYLNITSSSASFQQLQVQGQLKKLADETVATQNFVSETIKIDGILIEKTVQSYEGKQELFHIIFKAVTDQGKTLATFETLQYVP